MPSVTTAGREYKTASWSVVRSDGQNSDSGTDHQQPSTNQRLETHTGSQVIINSGSQVTPTGGSAATEMHDRDSADGAATTGRDGSVGCDESEGWDGGSERDEREREGKREWDKLIEAMEELAQLLERYARSGRPITREQKLMLANYVQHIQRNVMSILIGN